ncbi:hypothetical protein CR513_26984, partial [Mucuna pruriens]
MPSDNVVNTPSKYYISYDFNSIEVNLGQFSQGHLQSSINYAHSKSLLDVSNMNHHQERDPQLIKYWDKATKLTTSFEKFTLLHVPREQNERADLLSKMACTQRCENNCSIIHEKIYKPTVEEKDVFPGGLEATKRLKQEASKYTPEGVYGSHIGGQALASKIIRANVSGLQTFIRPYQSHYTRLCHQTLPQIGCQHPIPFLSSGRIDKISDRGSRLLQKVNGRVLFTTKDKIVFHLNRALSNKQTGGASQQGNTKRITKKIGGRKREMGRGSLSSVMVISYYTHSTTQEIPFRLTFNIKAVILVEIGEPSPRTTLFHQA